jgi:hypothetical protein
MLGTNPFGTLWVPTGCEISGLTSREGAWILWNRNVHDLDIYVSFQCLLLLLLYGLSLDVVIIIIMRIQYL